MAGDLKLKYSASVALTVTNLHSLATSSTNIAGWTSASVNNTSTLARDIIVSGTIVLNATAPTAGTSLKLYCYGAMNDTPNWPDLFSSGTEGTEGAATVHDEEQREAGMHRVWTAIVDTGTSETLTIKPTGLAQFFGSIPPYWALFFVHDMGGSAALSSSGSAIYYTPVLDQYT